MWRDRPATAAAAASGVRSPFGVIATRLWKIYIVLGIQCSMYYGSPPRESFAIRNAWSLKCLATVPRLDSYFITEERKHSSIWSWVADASINCNVGRRWGGTQLIKYLFQSATFRGAFTSVEELAQVGCRASRSTTLRRNSRRAHLTYINEIAFLNFALSFSSCDSENSWTVSITCTVFFFFVISLLNCMFKHSKYNFRFK